ncbi:TetR/AcrR family transcriptional regulator [Actinotalea subterranea]|uniref:TetR/AcrR family transcriptional regulator n=1 Tax=Actinotalea subterranea TaxID=2607497 RepID=UPI0011EF3EF1|nr:TetR/AcrR family transcriptional regulator [Actinotalea subterranea]
MAPSRTLRTRARLLEAALDLFERQGYEATTTQQVAAAAGVSQMTFFRHFPTKESVLVSDPYDPMLAELVAAQPADRPLIRRIHDAFVQALAVIEPVESASARRRVAIAAQLPALRGALLAATQESEAAVTHALVATGADPRQARVAASAAFAATGTALMAWAADSSGGSLSDVVTQALSVLVGEERPSGERP